MYKCSVDWTSTAATAHQIDWVDRVITIEEWLEKNVGARGTAWDWFNDTEFGQLGFVRERDCVWFILNWS